MADINIILKARGFHINHRSACRDDADTGRLKAKLPRTSEEKVTKRVVDMDSRDIHVVTGAFGFSGKYITERLLAAGHNVRTLTNSFNRENPFHGRVMAYPYNFNDSKKLIDSLSGASVLYNNYWVRFNHRNFSYAQAIENSLKLFDAAKQAGIKRIVHAVLPTVRSTHLSNTSVGRQNWKKQSLSQGVICDTTACRVVWQGRYPGQ